jgi:hypothetical protein
MGRVAEGASGISSGFCCAAKRPESVKMSPNITNRLLFLDIQPPFIFPSQIFPSQYCCVESRFPTDLPVPTIRLMAYFSFLEMPERDTLVHLTTTALYRID